MRRRWSIILTWRRGPAVAWVRLLSIRSVRMARRGTVRIRRFYLGKIKSVRRCHGRNYSSDDKGNIRFGGG
ncbi:uncharacterized protein BDW43DRAFT_148045 [Aspergillus alliaceus]|uniref:uncharacterized protein n=1 Tax=Petromyces alliaceus TaxID=209559 RepID=UPI0012A547B2|nr:uncharacterized protein BDW43DRAFT_148045 [Aspergillus alliaceus]KAB8230993.1 hypothetical protein BDW43DRAFT_148045 [Aspergillus alliaceus]